MAAEQDGVLKWRHAAAAIAAAGCAAVTASAHADITVSGDTANLSVRVEHATVRDVLTRLETGYGVRVEGEGLNPEISGHYQGRIETVVSDVLGNANFILFHAQGGLTVRMLSSAAAGATLPASQKTIVRVKLTAAQAPGAEEPVVRLRRLGSGQAERDRIPRQRGEQDPAIGEASDKSAGASSGGNPASGGPKSAGQPGTQPSTPGEQSLATRLFGAAGASVQIDEKFLNAYAGRVLRENTRPRQ